MNSLLNTLLLDCRKLFIRDMEVFAQIGIHEFEKNAPQRLLVDIDLYVPLSQSNPKNDHITDVVDYDFVRLAVLGRISQGQIGLQETLVDDLLDALLKNKGVRAARVATRKPDVYADCGSVGVETVRINPL